MMRAASRGAIPLCVMLGRFAALVAAQSPPPALSPAPAWPTAAAPLVFAGITVIDVTDGKRQAGQTVVIIGNRIQAVGPASKMAVPAGARVVDARGKYLIPGLWDMHMHPHDQYEWANQVWIATGVTGTRIPNDEISAPGSQFAVLRQVRGEIAAGTRVGPRMFMGEQAHAGQRNAPTTPAEAQRYVDSLKAAGADFLKMYDVPMDYFFLVARAARQAKLPIDGHTPQQITVAEASDSGHRILDHAQKMSAYCGFDGDFFTLDTAGSLEKCTALAARFRRNGTWAQIGPIGTFRYHWPARLTDAELLARLRYVPRRFLPDTVPLVITRQPMRKETFALVQRADLPILLGEHFGLMSTKEWDDLLTDFMRGWTPTVPGFSLHDGMALFVEHGLTPLRVLQAATRNPAEALGLADSLGTVAAGKVADLVVLDADPLADIYNTMKIRAVVANGRYFDRAALDTLLARVARLH